MAQHLKDGVPVIEQLHRQGVGFSVVAALALLAGGAQRHHPWRVLSGQIGREQTFTGGVDRRHQNFQGVKTRWTKTWASRSQLSAKPRALRIRCAQQRNRRG